MLPFDLEEIDICIHFLQHKGPSLGYSLFRKRAHETETRQHNVHQYNVHLLPEPQVAKLTMQIVQFVFSSR